jgi:hypothetical protein
MKVISIPKDIPNSVINQAVSEFNIVESFKNSLVRSSIITEANGVLNAAPITEIKAKAMAHHELVDEDEDYIVVEPKSHGNVCYYGQHSRSRFCVANLEDSTEWDKFEGIHEMLGAPAHMYIVFSKTLSLKNKNAIFAIIVYPKKMSDMGLRMSDEQLIAQGKQRFKGETGKDISYSDSFLLDWVKQIKKHNVMFESYNSNNKIVLPDDLEEALGKELFTRIIHNK